MTNEDLAALELRTMHKAWKSLDRRWNLSPTERLALFPAGGHDDERPPADTETRMRIQIEIGYRIGLPEDLLHDWLRDPNQTLAWLTPLDVMSGSLADLRGFRRLVDEGFAS